MPNMLSLKTSIDQFCVINNEANYHGRCDGTCKKDQVTKVLEISIKNVF